MESIEKLRDYINDLGAELYRLQPVVIGLITDVVREIAEKYMKLPVDADGVPIHVDDEMIYLNGGKRFTVKMIGNGFVRSEIGALYKASICRHVKPDPMEGRQR